MYSGCGVSDNDDKVALVLVVFMVVVVMVIDVGGD